MKELADFMLILTGFLAAFIGFCTEKSRRMRYMIMTFFELIVMTIYYFKNFV